AGSGESLHVAGVRFFISPAAGREDVRAVCSKPLGSSHRSGEPRSPRGSEMTLAGVRSPRALAPMLGVPPRVLFQICEASNRYYLPAKSKERGAGRPARRIDRPLPILKRVQRRAHDLILKSVVLPDYLHGGVPGHSPRTLAEHHLGTPCVVKIDVRDF